jgi:hypothetical protein
MGLFRARSACSSFRPFWLGREAVLGLEVVREVVSLVGRLLLAAAVIVLGVGAFDGQVLGLRVFVRGGVLLGLGFCGGCWVFFCGSGCLFGRGTPEFGLVEVEGGVVEVVTVPGFVVAGEAGFFG